MLKRQRVQLVEALRAGGRSASAGRDRNVTRNTLTIVQVALAVVLGSLASAAVASYVPARRLTRIHPIEALRAE